METPLASRITSQRMRWLIILAALTAGLLLRLWFVVHAARIAGDTLVYGDIAKNWLDYGVYGFTESPRPPQPTLIRLPGYPAFLALCFSLFGREHYTAVLYVQVALDLLTCLTLSALAGRLFNLRAAQVTLWLSALCPFTASYVSAPLAETLTLFCIAVAFYAFHCWQAQLRTASPINRWLYLLAASLAYSILLRPEQGLLAAAILPAMAWLVLRNRHSQPLIKALAPVLLTAVLIVLPLVPWTLRNWHTFHVFQPLAPRYATDPGEIVPVGFQRWFRTWAVDFTSTEDVYWNYDGAPVQMSDIPSRAFDTDSQYSRTEAILNEYNETSNASPAFDARFAALANERVHAKTLRYYVALPVARLLNMALRPRTEMLPIPLEWWKFHQHPGKSLFASAYAALNLAYFLLAGMGLYHWRSLVKNGRRWNGEAVFLTAMLATIVLRSALLLTLDNSEPRYTLEFFPVLILCAAALFSSRRTVEGR